jgi:hypothetical protein
MPDIDVVRSRVNEKLGGVYGAFGGSVYTVTATFTVTAALTLNQVIKMIQVPKGTRPFNPGSWVLRATDLDTGATPAIVLHVGDGDDTDRYVTGATVGQTSGTVFGTQHATATALMQYAADDTIDVLVATGPVTGAVTGSIILQAQFEGP